MFVVSGTMSIWDLDKVVAEELVHLILGRKHLMEPLEHTTDYIGRHLEPFDVLKLRYKKGS